MLAAVIRETPPDAPELWRRAFGLIVDGLVSRRREPSPLAVGPLKP